MMIKEMRPEKRKPAKQQPRRHVEKGGRVEKNRLKEKKPKGRRSALKKEGRKNFKP